MLVWCHLQALWEALTPNLYALFWGLSIHDIYVPKERYNIELEKVRGSNAWHMMCDTDMFSHAT